MLRMSSFEGKLEEADYLRRLASGAYEPVFIDVGCAQNRLDLQKLQRCSSSLRQNGVRLA